MILNIFIYLAFTIDIKCEQDRRVITTLKYSKFYVKPTVVNGKPATTGQVPYLVSIKEPIHKIGVRRLIWTNLCGGSIISETRILTAAHCFESADFYYKKHPDHLRVVAGNLRTSLAHSGDTETNIINQWREIEDVVLHGHFYFPKNDIAIVFIKDEWKFSNNVDYINVATKTTDYTSCMTAGFGRIGYSLRDKISPMLLIARINTLSQWKCNILWEMNMNTYICSDSSFTDVSRGDSGGPLVCRNSLDPAEEPYKDLLVGIVSGKNFDRTTLYTRVSEYHDWIARNEGFSNAFKFVYLNCVLYLFIYNYIILHYL